VQTRVGMARKGRNSRPDIAYYGIFVCGKGKM